MERPIVLWMTSRSRSSLVSRIFAEHGIWWGDTFVKTKGDYITYENSDIKRIQKNLKIDNSKKLPFCKEIHPDQETRDRFKRELTRVVHPSKRWSMKTGVEYFNLWSDLKPYNIFIYRNPEDVAKSVFEKGGESVEGAYNAAIWRYDYMKQCRDKYGGEWIDTDDIVRGDYTKVEKALAYCDIIYDRKKLEKAYEKKISK